MPIQDDVYDTSVRHAIDMERYKNGVVRRIIALLAAVDEDIVRLIRDTDMTEFSQQRLLLLEQQIIAMTDAGNDAMQRNLESDLKEMIDSEIDFHEVVVGAVAPVPDPQIGFTVPVVRLNTDDVYAAAMGLPFRGRTLKEWFDSMGAAKKRRLLDEIRIGFIEGESNDQIARRIMGTASAGYRDGVLAGVSRRNAETIVRTAVQYFNNFALRQSMIQSGVKWWLFTAVLDRRTTPECRGRSGKVYPVTPQAPWPPRHPRCRSVAVPLLSRDEVPDIPTYGEWLRKQPESVINDILGPTKAKLFISGNLSLDRFINRAGDELTIAQLRSRYPVAWAKAE